MTFTHTQKKSLGILTLSYDKVKNYICALQYRGGITKPPTNLLVPTDLSALPFGDNVVTDCWVTIDDVVPPLLALLPPGVWVIGG